MNSTDETVVPEEEQTPAQDTAPAGETAPAQDAAPADSEPEKLSRKEKKALEKAQAELEETQKKLAESNDKYLRMLAEYDNFRRRSQEERKNTYSDARADTICKLLPVYDNLSRAVQSEPSEETRKGMEAILTQFSGILSSMGVTEIEAVGKKFDPSLHEALLHIEDEKYGEGEIVLELEKGFMLGSKVIRFAKVQSAN